MPFPQRIIDIVADLGYFQVVRDQRLRGLVAECSTKHWTKAGLMAVDCRGKGQ